MLTLVALAVTSVVAAFASTAAARSEPRIAPTCLRTVESASACGLVGAFFDALDRGRTARACSLLGTDLLSETGGAACPGFLAPSGGAPHAIISARRTRAGVVVFVDVGLNEFDHYRMLRWAALVGPEYGLLRILETRRV
jgi:hypothetical protein